LNEQKKQRILQEYNFLVHLESMIEDFQVKLECHHRFHMYNIIRIVFQAFVLHRSLFRKIDLIDFRKNYLLELELIWIRH
jgi:tRNA 2-selenouridine synthase SelU